MSDNSVHDYSDLASTYDELRYVTPEQQFVDAVRYDAVKQCLNPKPSMHLIDVGTGTGSGIVFFASAVGKMVGLDGTAAMLERARAKAKEHQLTNVEFVHADALKIPYDANTFDSVISLNFIHLFVPEGLDRQRAFVSEMERVCKPGGRVVIEFDNATYLDLGNRYADLPAMSNTMHCEAIVGTYFPKTAALYRLNSSLARAYTQAARTGPLSRLAYKWVVSFVKRR